MKTARKVLMIALCAVLLVSISVMGTMAYLTSQDTVTNTFTVGNVAITLDEAKVNTDGTLVTGENAGRTDGNAYHLLPGHTYIKDPTIHVASTSEDCWLFVKVENGIAAIEDSSSTIAAQMATKGWAPVAEGSNVYCRTTTNKAGDNVVVFDNFKISGNADVSKYATAKNEDGSVATGATVIAVTAYAIQADGFEGETASDIWTAANFAA